MFGRDGYDLRICQVPTTPTKRGVAAICGRRGFCCFVLKPIIGRKRFQVISLYTMAETATTVRLNVGGVHFEVSRSLIAKHDSSMLARLVSDTWQADPEAIIFIDRDGETFRHCLDFLRYGRVTLPLTVARDAFLRDMDYYGMAVVDASLVGVGGFVAQAATCIAEWRKQSLVEVKGSKLKIACIELTEECLSSYSLDGSLTFQFHEDKTNPNSKKQKLFDHAATVYQSKESFVEYLGKYGFGIAGEGIFRPYDTHAHAYTICLTIAAPIGATPIE